MHTCYSGSRSALPLNADALRDFDLFSAIAVTEDGRHFAIEGVVAVGDRPLAEARVALANLLRNLCCMDARPTSKFALVLGLGFPFKGSAHPNLLTVR